MGSQFSVGRRSFLPALVLSLLLSPSVFFGTAAAQGLKAGISSSNLTSLATAAQAFNQFGKTPEVSLKLPVEDGLREIRLVPHDIRGPNYRAEVTGPGGRVSDPVTVDLFKGADGTEVGGEFFRFALIKMPGQAQPELRGFFREKDRYYRLGLQSSSGYRVTSLSESEVAHEIATCGVHTDLAGDLARFRATDQVESAGVGAAALKIAELATDADFEYVQAEGGEAGANATILAIINGVNGIYEPQLNLRLSVVYQHAWTTSNDPYTSLEASARLGEFLTEWSNNFKSVPRDLAHLFTGVDLTGSTIGIAYLGVVCDFFAYGVSQRLNNPSGDVPLVAHEIGHNFDSDHDTNCSQTVKFVMCPALSLGVSTFSPTSVTQINNYVSRVSCLASDSGGGPNSAPVLAPIGAKATSVGQTLSFMASATDADGDTLSYGASPLPQGASFSGRTFTFTPIAAGTFNITFSVSDGRGGTDSELVAVTVTGQNNPPVLTSPGSMNTSEGSLFSLTLSASDPDGGPLSFRARDLPDGASFNAAGGIFAWKPAGNQSGAYAIEFTVVDSGGASDSKTLLLTVNDTPGVPELPAVHVQGDLDGDGAADVAVFRNTTGDWYSGEIANAPGQFVQQQFGLPGDVPVPGDYNGDRITDYAVYRPSTNSWFILNSGTGQLTSFGFGIDGDLPAPADYDGDGREDIAVYRPSTGLFIHRSSRVNQDLVSALGQAGDIPVPCDYDGDGFAEPAVFRPSTGTWLTLDGGATTTVQLGALTDIPAPEDFDGNGTCDRAVYNPSTGNWLVEGNAAVQFGLGGDIPVPANYDGQGGAEFAVFRPYEALWYVRLSGTQTSVYQLGLPSDLVAPREAYYYAARNTSINSVLARSEQVGNFLAYRRSAQALFTVGLSAFTSKAIPAGAGSTIVRGDYDGDGSLDVAVFQAGFWNIALANGGSQFHIWGQAGDIPVSGNFDGDNRDDIAVFRPDEANGFSRWYVIQSSTGLAEIYNWGLSGDIPVAADFNGDGWTDPAVVRASTMVWYVMDGRSKAPISAEQFGLPGDTIRIADFDRDGRADKTVFRSGTWFVRHSGGAIVSVAYGLPGDVAVPGAYVDPKSVDYAVFRPSTGTLFVLTQGGVPLSASTPIISTDQVVGVKPGVPLL